MRQRNVAGAADALPRSNLAERHKQILSLAIAIKRVPLFWHFLRVLQCQLAVGSSPSEKGTSASDRRHTADSAVGRRSTPSKVWGRIRHLARSSRSSASSTRSSLRSTSSTRVSVIADRESIIRKPSLTI